MQNAERGTHRYIATGRILTGYVAGNGKPKGMSDERWQEVQRLWAVKRRRVRSK